MQSHPQEVVKDVEEKTAELARLFRAPLLAYFSKRVRARNEAEDLTQEVFVRLLHHPDRHQGQSIEAYIFTIAGNLLRDRAKSVSAAHERLSYNVDLLAEAGYPLPALIEDRDPERVLVGRETVDDVLGALAELGERTRDVFILARLENLQHKEIAEMFGLSVSSVEKMIMKAMAHLGARFLEL
ncbi:MAG TPA: sigma-70 family RNA polymerase sigma factor [Magnetospirillaceae bacterium]|nr:sigma-70 family RNA polymerase sigma factor [Magnetospirillaceae bacterium]